MPGMPLCIALAAASVSDQVWTGNFGIGSYTVRGASMKSEDLEFKLTLSHVEYREIMNVFPEFRVESIEGDEININYKLVVEYFDNCKARLEAILKLRTLVRFDAACLNGAKSTILEIGKLLERFDEKNNGGVGVPSVGSTRSGSHS